LALSLFEFFWWPLMRNFTNQAGNFVYAMATLWHKSWYQDMDTMMIWYMQRDDDH
jgi:hypothetical protein